MAEVPIKPKRYINAHPLTEMQKLFIKYYAEGCGPKEAAIKAGYNPRDAYKRANEILKKPACKGIIAIGVKRATESTNKEIAEGLKTTLGVVRSIIEAGTTPEKLEKMVTPGHVLSAIDIEAKILGFYAPEKSFNVNVNMEIERTQRLNELIKEKERGY